MDREKLISIIVPVYNIEKYIEKCILSIINQTYKNLQIILVDDGSTDCSGQICDDYMKKDQRIQVIHQKNAGLVCARKAGLEKAEGAFVGFVDGDDYIDRNMFFEMLQDILLYDVDFVHTGYFKEKNGNVEIRADFESGIYDIENSKADFLRHYILEATSGKSISYSIWSKLFKKELIEKCYQRVPSDQSYGEDLLALIACIFESDRIYLRKKAYYHYVYRNNSITNTGWLSVAVKTTDLYKCLRSQLEHYKRDTELESSLNRWFQMHIIENVLSMQDIRLDMQRYFYPNIPSLFGKRIALYGAGTVGKDYYAQFCKYVQCKVVVWADKNASKYGYEYNTIVYPEQILKYDFDVCVIAVNGKSLADKIKHELVKYGIKEKKIIWHKPKYLQ